VGLGKPKETTLNRKIMSEINIESPSVQSYLGILQGVINRMAANSSGCKTWCVALVSAIVVIIADKGRPEYVWISIVPIFLFLFLDSYYLGLEKRFRNRYNEFIQRLHSNRAVVEDLFIVTPGVGFRIFFKATREALISLSVWPFYGLLTAMLFILRYWLLQTP
jgi:hypothetical protein